MNNVIKQVIMSMWSHAHSVNATCIILSRVYTQKMVQYIIWILVGYVLDIVYLNVLRKVRSIPSVIVLSNSGRVH